MNDRLFGTLGMVFGILGMIVEVSMDVIAVINGYWWLAIIAVICIIMNAYFSRKQKDADEWESRMVMIENLRKTKEEAED